MDTPLQGIKTSEIGWIIRNVETLRCDYGVTKKTGENMKTGTEAQKRGMYASTCCDYELDFPEDQTFTRCPKCQGLTTWELIDIDWPMAA